MLVLNRSPMLELHPFILKARKRRGSHCHLQLFLFLLNLMTQLDFRIVHLKDDLSLVILYCNQDPSFITKLREKIIPQYEED